VPQTAAATARALVFAAWEHHAAAHQGVPSLDKAGSWEDVPYMHVTAVQGLDDDESAMTAALRQLASLTAPDYETTINIMAMHTQCMISFDTLAFQRPTDPAPALSM